MEAERGEVDPIWKKYAASHRWTGAIVARDEDLRGGIGRVLGEPDASGIAWVYWGKSDHGKHEAREVVVEMVRLDLNDGFMRDYRRYEEDE